MKTKEFIFILIDAIGIVTLGLTIMYSIGNIIFLDMHSKLVGILTIIGFGYLCYKDSMERKK